jgi:hypothetical protein
MEVLDDLWDALSAITSLPLRLQRIALLRGLGLKREDIVAITGDSETRVGHLMREATFRIDEIVAEWRHAENRSPRADRLWELEHEPPDWLVAEIGRPPRRHRNAGQVAARRAWRRAALALDDYRTAAGAEGLMSIQDESPGDPALRALHAAAQEAIGGQEQVRDRRLDR